MNALIAERILGWTPHDVDGAFPYWRNGQGEITASASEWYPTSNVAQAVYVAQAMAGLGWIVSLKFRLDGHVCARAERSELLPDSQGPSYEACSEYPALAICLVCLQAVGESA